MAVEQPLSPPMPPPPQWGAVLSTHAAVSAFVAFFVTVIWALTGLGDYFWPIWVWFGVGVPLAFHTAVYLGCRATPGRQRGLAVHGAITWAIVGTLLTIWLLTGMPEFWPMIPSTVLITLVAAHAMVVRLWPTRREAQLVQRVDELTRTRRGALDVQAAELRRIERDLHDGAQARLVALSMQLGRAEERLDDQPELADMVRRARGEASAAIAELRDLARGIAPPVLADRGLPAAVEALGRRSIIPVVVESNLSRRALPVVETAAYFVIAEAITNAAKHARGASATVRLIEEPGHLVVEVDDDGPGGADPAGSGLTGLRHRVQALDGSLAIVSNPGEGTTIRAELPCEW